MKPLSRNRARKAANPGRPPSPGGGTLARLFVVGIWGGFFWYLWLGGQASRFVGSRTDWVVPFGAVVLAAVALGGLLRLRSAAPHDDDAARRGLSTREGWGLLALLAPVVVAAALPAAGLGSFAFSERAAPGNPAALSALAGGAIGGEAGGEAGAQDDFLAVASAAYHSPEQARRFGTQEGSPVALRGFVVPQEAGAEAGAEADDGTVTLGRFLVSCCAADAIAYRVRVALPEAPGEDLAPVLVGRPGAGASEDTWVWVRGRLSRARNGDPVVVATEAHRTSEPDEPYLSAAR